MKDVPGGRPEVAIVSGVSTVLTIGMMLLLCVTLSLVLGISLTSGDDSYCPPKSNIEPCYCAHGIFYDVIGTRVSCREIKDPQSLKNIFENFRGYEIDLLEFTFADLPYLPSGVFDGNWVRKLSIKDSLLSNLYSVKEYNPSPFQGLENSLQEFYVTSTRDPSKWFWPDLKNLTKLRLVEFQQSPIDFVGHVFAEIGGGSLEDITVSYCRVYRIHPQAFPSLTNLVRVNFEGNFIPYMSRTMFPNPALKLRSINLRYNMLDNLPEDMFVNMPALRYLDLSENQFRSFPENIYEPIWQNLRHFFISSNPATCDCELLWLKQSGLTSLSSSNYDAGHLLCSHPTDLEGFALKALREDELTCAKENY